MDMIERQLRARLAPIIGLSIRQGHLSPVIRMSDRCEAAVRPGKSFAVWRRIVGLRISVDARIVGRQLFTIPVAPSSINSRGDDQL